jgi:hypothetical protein
MPLALSTRSGSRHPALDLVGDEHDAVRRAPLLQGRQVAVGGNDEAALALDRLDHQAGQIGCPDRLLEVGDRARGSLRAREPVVQRVRVRRPVHVAREGPVAERVGHGFEVHRHRQVGAAVVGVLEHGHAAAAGVLARDLHAVLDRFGSRVDQHGLLGEVARGVLGQELGDAHVLLVGRDGEERVDDLAELPPRRGHDVVVSVPDRRDADAGAEVEEGVVVDIHQDRPVRPGDEHRQGARDACAHGRGAAGLQGDRLGPGDGRDDAALGGHRCGVRC